MAPLFFTFLAEGSLTWRREQVAAADDAVEQAGAYGKGHLAFMKAAYRAQDGLVGERDSIEALDLFGKEVGDDAHDWGYDSSTDNPFAAYLRKLADDLGNADVVCITDDALGFGLSFDYPNYDVCGVELDRISHYSEKARWVLEVGHARFDEIPPELQGADAGAERARWLESKAPPPPAGVLKWLDSLPDDDVVAERLQAQEADLSELLPPVDDATGEDT